jgi:hypothetical protein
MWCVERYVEVAVCAFTYMGELDGLPALVEEHSTHGRGVESRCSWDVQRE